MNFFLPFSHFSDIFWLFLASSFFSGIWENKFPSKHILRKGKESEEKFNEIEQENFKEIEQENFKETEGNQNYQNFVFNARAAPESTND